MAKFTPKRIVFFFLLSSAFLLVFSATARAQMPEKEFDPDYILSDSEMLDHDTMDKEEIQDFLEEHNSFLADYSCESAYGEHKTAAEIIYDASYNNFDCEGKVLGNKISLAEMEFKCDRDTTINPQALLVLLQKEMSLIEDPDPQQSQLDWATGYGCPDGQSCNPRWKGFGKQVNSAALQFKDYMENPDHYNYRAGETYELDNPYSNQESTTIVTPENRATAALYNYTPHAYNGNYNFHKLWHSYFGSPQKYPNGSLLQVKGEPGVWLIEDGQKRPFHSLSALRSRFNTDKIVQVDKSALAGYQKGVPIKLPNYSIVRAPNGSLYLLVDESKRPFASYDIFKNIGFNPEEIVNASWQTIRSYDTGETINSTSTYPTGALLQNKDSGGVYWVYSGKKHPLLHPVLLHTKFREERIIPVAAEELAQYEKAEAVKYDSGELLTTADSPGVYLIAGEEKRAFTSGQIFLERGYQWKNIISVPKRIIDLYSTGEPISE